MNPRQQPGDPVKHVVLLMFENHSFDQMLGCFKEIYPELDGVDPNKPAVNRADGKEFRQAATTERQMAIDPRHELNHVLAQIRDHNGGFVQDFLDANKKNKQISQAQLDEQCGFVMGYYPLGFLRRCTFWRASF